MRVVDHHDADIERIESTIASLESQRAVLGDLVVDTAVGPLRSELVRLSGAPDPPVTAPRSSRRQVTVVFADLTGYTTLSEGQDPESVLDMLTRFWGEVDGIFAEHRGKVLAHMGDGVMAVWGAEEATEEDAELAVRSSLKAVEYVKEHGVTINGEHRDAKMSVGVHTGQVHVGVVGNAHELTAIGDTTNVAARLEGLAHPNQVLISRQTFHHVRGVFDVSEAGSVQLKGRAGAITAYAIDRERPRAFRTPRRGVEGVDTALSGRTNELAVLQRAHSRCVGADTVEIVTISGEPGIGKSRLVAEFRDWMEISTSTPVRYFEGTAVRDRAEQPFALLRNLIANRFEISDSDPLDVVMAKLVDGLEQLTDPVVAAQAPTVAWVLGFAPSSDEAGRGDSQLRSRAARSTLVDTLVALVTPLPALLIVEDLHWADEASLSVLADVVALLPAGLMLFCTTRPELRNRNAAWCSPEGLGPSHRVIELGPLCAEAVEALIDDVLQRCDEVPDELRLRLSTQAGGNPFYVEELIKMLIDRGVIATGETWTVDSALLEVSEVPTTLAGVLQSRLDHLPASQYLALQRASILGRTFWDRSVAALLDAGTGDGTGDDRGGVDLARVQLDLDATVSAEFTHRVQPSRVEGSLEFEFNHDLNRAVTYETVSLKERPALHGAAALWMIDALGDRVDEFAATIARHLEQSGDDEGASGWFERAAKLARSQSAYGESASLLAEAAKRAVPNRRDGLLVEQADALIVAGRHEDAGTILSEVLSRADDDAVLFGEAANGLAGLAMFRDGDFDGAARILHEALDRLLASSNSDTDHRRGELVVRQQLGNLKIITGMFAEAISIFEDCLSRGLEAFPRRRALTLNSLAHSYAQMGRTADTHRTAELTEALAAELGEPRLAMGAHAQRGVVALRQSDFVAARRWFTNAQQLNQRNGDLEKLATVWNYLGEISAGLFDLERAADEFNEAIAVATRCGAVTEVVRAVVGHAGIRAEAGDMAWASRVVFAAQKHPAAGGEAARSCASVVSRYGLIEGSHGAPISINEAVAELTGAKP